MQTPEFFKQFLTEEEQNIGDQFLKNGYVIAPVADQALLNRIRNEIASFTANYLKVEVNPADYDQFLNSIGTRVAPTDLNPMRLAIIEHINKQSWLRAYYFRLAKNLIEPIVGNEISMQRRVNLSIQLPNDTSSLLPIHADAWSGDSGFEVVVWLPLVNCFKTKSMYLVSVDRDKEIQETMAQYSNQSSEDLFHIVEKDAQFIDIPFGHVMLFSQNIMHGNRINIESEARWSMNCRFKSLLSPHADKKLGEFFEPITLRPATRLGYEYKLPTGFKE